MLTPIKQFGLVYAFQGNVFHPLSYNEFLTWNELVSLEFCRKYHPARLLLGVFDSYFDWDEVTYLTYPN